MVLDEIVRQEASEKGGYDQYISVFREAVGDLGIEQTSKDWFYEWINNLDRDILFALLIAKLPNLQALSMTIPEEQAGVLSTLADLGNRSTPGVLDKLRTMYVCSALHIGVSNYLSS